MPIATQAEYDAALAEIVELFGVKVRWTPMVRQLEPSTKV